MTRTVAAARTSAAARTAVTGAIRRVGLVDRNNQPSNGYDDSLAVPIMVCSVNWSDLQSAQGANLAGSTTVVATLNQTLSTGIWTGGALTVSALSATVNTQAMIRIGNNPGYLVGVSNSSSSGATSLSLPPFVSDANYASGTNVYMLLGTDAIDAALAWAARTGVGRAVKLRIFAGGRASAAWVQNIADPAAVNLPTGVSATPFTVSDKNNSGAGGLSGAMWTQQYRNAEQDLLTKINAKYSGNGYLASIDVGIIGSSLGVEPMIWGHLIDTAGVNNCYMPSCMTAMMAGASGANMLTALENGQSDGSTLIPNRWVEYACNPYHNLLTGTAGTGKTPRLPQTISAFNHTTGAMTVTGTPWTNGDYNTTGNNFFALGVFRTAGKWTANPSGQTLLTDANATFVASGVVAGDIVYSDGNTYTVQAPITATTLTISAAHDGNGDDTGFTYFIVPAAVAAGPGFPISGVVTGSNAVTITGGGAVDNAWNGLLCLPVGVTWTNSGADESTTRTLITAANFANLILANHSPRASSNLVPTTGAPFKDMGAATGVGKAPWAYQTASDANINGTDANTTGLNNLWVTLSSLMQSTTKPVDIELPNGYSASYAGTNAGGAGTVVTDANLPGGTNVWGNGNGKLGACQFTVSGNWYLVTSNTATTFTCTSTLKAGVDDQAGKTYTIYKWDYLSPALAKQMTASLAGISGARQPINTARTAS